jgi:integrase
MRTKGNRRYKDSSVDTTRSQLGHFKREYGTRPLAWLDTNDARYDAVRWAPGIPAGCVQTTTILVNRAVDERLLTHNPFKSLGRRVEGRANETPPTEQQFASLLKACDVLGDYAPRMRALFAFGAHSLMRPGELMAIEWPDIDLPSNRGHVRRRLYRGRIDLPKSNRVRTFALTPPARDALLTLPERDGLVFRNKSGDQLTQPTLTAYWKEVKARAGLEHDWYLATKHYGCWYMKVKLGLPNHVIAAQAGWSEKSVEKMVETYAHSEIGALDAIDAAWGNNVVPLRAETTEMELA